MFSNDVLPNYGNIKNDVKKYAESAPFLYLCNKPIVDRNGHTIQIFTDEDEREYYHILEHYQWYLHLYHIQLINQIFWSGIKKEKLSAALLLDFIHKECWFGKNLQKDNINDQVVTYNWLSVIAPSLHEYFHQINLLLSGAVKYPNLVMCIDSLTLKIEGLFRDLYRFKQIPTFFQTRDSKGREIVKEKDINALLHEDEITSLFNVDEILFFRYLFVEKKGYNLRNDVAHSFLVIQEYTVEVMHLLILAILRLGKFDFTNLEN